MNSTVLCGLFFLLMMSIGDGTSRHEEGASGGKKDQAVDKRIEDLLRAMTIEEKVGLVSGTGFETRAIPRLGIPPLKMTDGPVGVRWEKASAFPVSMCMAASWDPPAVEKIGSALGRETKARGRNMLLGPCVNIQRVPHGGRSFESFGEDPYLASRMAVAWVQGVQGEKVVACVKHYACNNQEYERDFVNVQVDERTLREIYLPAFRAAVQEGGSMTVMAAYNKVNGAYCAENGHLLNDILKDEWGFKGFAVSDWGAVHSTVPTANAGMDLEMPDGRYLSADLLAAIKRGEVKEGVVEDKVRRILRVIFWAGLFDQQTKADRGAMDTKEHREIALQVAREGIVLLQNRNHTLPLDRQKIKSIAVLGPNAGIARVGGGGSAAVSPLYSVSPLEGLKKKLDGAIEISYSPGCVMEGDLAPIESSYLIPPEGKAGEHGLKGEYFNNMELKGTPVLTRIDKDVSFDWGSGSPGAGVSVDTFSVRWTGFLSPPTSGRYTLSVQTDDGVRLFLDDRLIIENWTNHAPETRSREVDLVAGRKHKIRFDYYENRGGAVARLGWTLPGQSVLSEAVALAKKADVAIVFAGLSNLVESEGFDRMDIALPSPQLDLIKAVSEVNKNTIVVFNSGAPLLLPDWINGVPSLLQAWYPGEEAGNAIADVLFGDVNPSGKLPITWLRKWEDSPAFANYPGKDSVVQYAEGVFVGYRHFDAKNIDPLFPFGHGLSYTTFEYAGLQVTPAIAKTGDSVEVTIEVRNTGSKEGSEVVQVYIGEEKPSVPRPPKELRGFKRISLKPGETQKVSVAIPVGSLGWYDVKKKDWVVGPGKYSVVVGSSSRDLRARGSFGVQ